MHRLLEKQLDLLEMTKSSVDISVLCFVCKPFLHRSQFRKSYSKIGSECSHLNSSTPTLCQIEFPKFCHTTQLSEENSENSIKNLLNPTTKSGKLVSPALPANTAAVAITSGADNFEKNIRTNKR